MIFKSEEPNIKKISTETLVVEEVNPEFPFEYRTELATQDREKMIQQLAEFAQEAVPDSYLQLAARMKFLGVSFPLPNDSLRTRIRNHVVASAKVVIEDEIDYVGGLTVESIIAAALMDKTLFDAIVAENKEIFDGLAQGVIDAVAESYPSWSRIILARLLEPSTKIPEPPQHVLDTQDDRVASLHDPEEWDKMGNWHFILESYAESRLAGVYECNWQHLFSWSQMRRFFFSPEAKRMRNIQHFAADALNARILNAEKVWISTDGLHIADPPLDVRAKEPAPVPSRKHI